MRMIINSLLVTKKIKTTVISFPYLINRKVNNDYLSHVIMTKLLRRLLCKLGIHSFSSKLYHEEKGSYVEHSEKICRYCGKKVKGTRKFDWDKS